MTGVQTCALPSWRKSDGAGRGTGNWRKPDRNRFNPMAGHRATPPRTASLLDRTAWLLARHASVWLELSGESHEFLVAQPAPYGEFFAALERVLHEQGTITMNALIDEMRQLPGQADGDEPDAPSTLRPLLDRLAGFHEVDDDEAPAQLVEAVLRRLRQFAVKDELDWLIESGELSEAAIARRNELFALTKELKNPPGAGPAGRN